MVRMSDEQMEKQLREYLVRQIKELQEAMGELHIKCRAIAPTVPLPRPPQRTYKGGLKIVLEEGTSGTALVVQMPISPGSFLRIVPEDPYLIPHVRTLLEIADFIPSRVYEIGQELRQIADWFSARVKGVQRARAEIIRQQQAYIDKIYAENTLSALAKEVL